MENLDNIFDSEKTFFEAFFEVKLTVVEHKDVEFTVVVPT